MTKSKIQLHKLYFRESYNYNFMYYFFKNEDEIIYAQCRYSKDEKAHNFVFEKRNFFDFNDLYVLKDQALIQDFIKSGKGYIYRNTLESIIDNRFNKFYTYHKTLIEEFINIKRGLITFIFNQRLA